MTCCLAEVVFIRVYFRCMGIKEFVRLEGDGCRGIEFVDKEIGVVRKV